MNKKRLIVVLLIVAVLSVLVFYKGPKKQLINDGDEVSYSRIYNYEQNVAIDKDVTDLLKQIEYRQFDKTHREMYSLQYSPYEIKVYINYEEVVIALGKDNFFYFVDNKQGLDCYKIDDDLAKKIIEALN